jgi:integrase
MHLTKRVIDAAAYRDSGNARCVLWDDSPVGLGLRIFPSGRKAFVLSYRNTDGVKRLTTLGDYGVLTLDQAQRQARRLLVAVEEKADPQLERRRVRLEAKTGSVEAMFRAYIEARTGDSHRPMKRPEAALWLAEKFIFPRLGSRPWRDVHRSEIREWHDGIRSTYNANRALQALRAAFYWRLWQEDDAPGNRRRESDTRNPCAGIDLRPESSRQVRLELDELPKLEAAIDAETDDPYLQAFFRFVLATGCRRNEALTLRWDDVTLPGEPAQQHSASATFRDTKAGADHTVRRPHRAALGLRCPAAAGPAAARTQSLRLHRPRARDASAGALEGLAAHPHRCRPAPPAHPRSAPHVRFLARRRRLHQQADRHGARPQIRHHEPRLHGAR